jgi:uncharacterized protein (DUF952 family)
MDLHHVITRTAWEQACQAGQHAPVQDFLHCCTPAQLGFVLAKHFAGATGLLVLTFDPASVPAELRWVHSEPGLPPFPHLYGPIPVAAVRSVTPVDASQSAGR